MFEKLAGLFASWHANLKHWHVMWYVGTFIRTLARNFKKLARFWHVGKQAGWRGNHAGMQARWHVDHVSTQVRMAHDLAN